MITFILRISFIKPIFSQLHIQKKTQMKYHFLCLNIFYDEVCNFLKEKNYHQSIAINSRKIIPLIILMKNFNYKNQSSCFLQFDMYEIIKANYISFLHFKDLLKLMQEKMDNFETNKFQEMESTLQHVSTYFNKLIP